MATGETNDKIQRPHDGRYGKRLGKNGYRYKRSTYGRTEKNRKGFVLTRGSGRLFPSDLALVLQYGSGPFPDILAKMLGVDTPLFLFAFIFFLPLFTLENERSTVDFSTCYD
jgi:hypothetical protein